MQSKQKTGGKARKQVSRPAGSKAGARRQQRRQGSQARPERKIVSVPAASTFSNRRFYGLKFGAAAPHDEFPEGGLRIVGVLPGSTTTDKLNGDYSGGGLGLWGTAGAPCAGVAPGGISSSGSIGTALLPLFNSSGPLAQFSQYFRRFRFRRLAMEYSTSITTSNANTTTLQISYERDPYSAASFTAATTISTAVNGTSVRFPAWEPRMMIELIREPKADRADELWYTTASGDSITDSDPSNMRASFQGAVSAIAPLPPPSAETIYGECLWFFTLDLYGFTNKNATAVPARRKVAEPDFELVSLNPKSRVDQADEKARDPPSVRTGSRK